MTNGKFLRQKKNFTHRSIILAQLQKVNQCVSDNLRTKLDQRQAFLIKLITNTKFLESTVESLSIDHKKFPFGMISINQLESAYNILIDIKNLIDQTTTLNLMSNSDIMAELLDMSSSFYTLIPYLCGRKKPPVINSDRLINKFNNIIEELYHLSMSNEIISDSKNLDNLDNLDNLYDSLCTNITPLHESNIMWNVILDYITNTIGHTHSIKIEVIDIYALEKINNICDCNNLVVGKKNNNTQLLWHGSRIANFCSIIKNGLILNPEKLNVTISGKMFSQGLYFASSFSKSFNYCCPDISDGYACLLLSEVHLGNQLIQTQANPTLSLKKLKKHKFDSTSGQ